jgi:hypothetical protein
MNEMSDSLLAADEPAPVTVHNENGLSPFLIVADHGGNVIPRALRGLGVSEAERRRHIAWDIGIAAVSRLVADALDATLVQQNYSRLVIDCNRAPHERLDLTRRNDRPERMAVLGVAIMQQIAAVPQGPASLHGHVAGDLPHPRSPANSMARKRVEAPAVLGSSARSSS